ncbi:tetratricopeptide repeat protein [Flavobacterium cerinum]|uniref:Tetratricopeptide repeat protein n=1 Tax=Flavobacterium cerinum TaxID=2502784 RepID=A0A3S3SFN5_9FLAO|nr:tetratricopeptide repeat protein [Flavobacterium cerinum]RWX01495.1 tetratricopeptide repeat protein [Flavobacterium cerinum]
MKGKYAIAAALLFSLSGFAQKEELKALKKLDDKEKPTAADFQEYKRLLTEVEPKMEASTLEQQIEFNYYKGTFALVEMQMNPAMAQMNFSVMMKHLNKVIELEKNGKKKYTEEIQKQIFPEVKTAILTMANQLVDQKKFKEAGMYFASAYKIEPKDYSILYNAAASAVNAQDYDNALKYYLELDQSGFTGASTAFTAKNKKTGTVEGFPNKATRDIAVKTGEYIEPKDEKVPSVKGEIVKNIALIYGQKGETEKAKQAMANARKANPDDVSLLIAEADLYLKTKDNEMYKKLITEAVQKSPNDADLFYNLGVVSSETNKEEAIKHYNRALEINPNYVNALINLGVLMLADEQKIVDDMNKITGTTAKDNQRYDALKAQRDGLYKKSLPYLEKAYKIEPDNQYVISLLASVYQALERDADYKVMKAKIKA